MNTVPLTVLIPTFNQMDLLWDCLQSIRNQTLRPDEILVVDDGSTDNIREMIDSNFPDAQVIRLETNSGFCVAVNKGLHAVKTDFVLLLNNDMTLEPECIANLMRDANQRTIRTPLVLFQSDPGTIYSAGDRVLISGRPEAIGFRKPREGFEMPSSVFCATGGAALVPRVIFDRIGYFDDKFFAYFEDTDFCVRARWAGFACELVPEALAFHVGSASLGGKTWTRSMLCYRNHALLIVKNYPLSMIVRFLPAIVFERLHQARMMFSSARTEFGAVRALGVALFAAYSLLSLLPHAIRARSHLRGRAISNSDFAALLTRPADRR